ncbi:hypothetical protein [Cryptosporangium japonicum]|uniref:Uncharacterized protein n=1 Tax=Cryptosporangium japonicum TaxID=80872 RepID=A0ABN0UX78_9ACTN
MTSVRQQREGIAKQPEATRKRTPSQPRARRSSADIGPSKLAQVRLRADEMDALQLVMRTLGLASTSDALREGLRLLAHEAAEVEAAKEIRAFYGKGPAPLPDGVAPPTEAELAAADEIEW